MTRTPSIMIQGTSSNAGKSMLVAGLCRAFTKRGLNVRPFKPQNMSNNAAATPQGSEIGRAQFLQARACRVPAHHHMNPVLLKPESEIGSQVIVQGKRVATVKARDYHELKPRLMAPVLDSFTTLGHDANLIIVEGAGSPAEVNLRAGDIANMGFAIAADVPVILVGDIERGGVIASIVGTETLLDEAERRQLKGYIINKFRGDPSLFDNAHPIITERTGLENLGVATWFAQAADLPEEDVLGLQGTQVDDGEINIAVPHLPRIANFDDLDPLRMEPRVNLRICRLEDPLPEGTDLILLPGSKSTISDFFALERSGWSDDIRQHHRQSGAILGLCGGYQMLGRTIADPHGIEGPARSIHGLGLLDVTTILEGDKTVQPSRAQSVPFDCTVDGYEIHLGRTFGPDCVRPMLEIERLDQGSALHDGAITTDGLVMGCYMHGILHNDTFRRDFLEHVRRGSGSDLRVEQRTERALDALGDHLESCLDMDRILDIASAR